MVHAFGSKIEFYEQLASVTGKSVLYCSTTNDVVMFGISIDFTFRAAVQFSSVSQYFI